jgi:crotonobetainyl-CoA:carnitine CoA-transferase CaiB-like acyl-CoA transferase
MIPTDAQQPRQAAAPSGPLAGLTVLDLTHALAGPFASFLLAGLGARVIKIENPCAPDPCRQNPPYLGPDGVSLGRKGEDDVSVSALNRLRGKYGVTLNLKKPRSREVFADLIRQADIVVENFSAGTLDRLGIGYAFARSINSRVIYCSISGFGATKTTGTGKAMDSIIQALSGLMMTSGAPGDPPVRVGVPMADLLAPVFAVIGILAALRQREFGGAGQQVDVSMLGVLTSLVAAEPFDLLEACGLPQRTGLMVPRLTPFGIYESADGHVAICAPSEHFARGVFAAIGRPEFETDPRFENRDARVAHVDELNAHIEAFTRTKRDPTPRAFTVRLKVKEEDRVACPVEEPSAIKHCQPIGMDSMHQQNCPCSRSPRDKPTTKM